MTLNGVVAVIFVISAKSLAFGAHCVSGWRYSQTFCDRR